MSGLILVVMPAKDLSGLGGICASSAILRAGEREPWSEVESDGAYESSRADHDIEIPGLDGQVDFDRKRTRWRIKPGAHYLQIAPPNLGYAAV